ncbi:MAG TPA: hypothetical protein VMD31_02260 [Opitutaceae bacterium]|nr:hypothetical protein [Opitutaceae bacterium]
MQRTTTFLAGGALALLLGAGSLAADPLTRSLDLDFGRDVASRDLKGLATRSDGRIVPGPTLTPLTGAPLAELLWTVAPAAGGRWLVGTGPDGRILEITLAGTGYTVRPVAKLAEPQVFALQALPDGSLLAGTSPTGALYLLKDGKPVSRVVLPVDSIFDIILLPSSTQNPEPKTPNPVALVATGNPGRIYRVDLGQFAAAGVTADRISDAKLLGEKGITLFGEIRDRNVRRLARLADGRIAAGSAPRGNVYGFPAAGGAPLILQENREAEVTDLLPQPDGDLFASIVFSSVAGERRINRPGLGLRPAAPGTLPADTSLPEPAPPTAGPDNAGTLPPAEAAAPEGTHERFAGRSAIVRFPANGFPETLLTRNGLAFYRLARRGDLLLIAAGEEGAVLAWDLPNRLSLTLPGAEGAQLNGLVPLDGAADRFLLLQNNAPGLALLDFGAPGPRQLETKRLDLGLPAALGNLRFDSLRNLAPEDLRIEARTSFGADETEGWSGWMPLAVRDGAFYAPGLRGRYVKLRITVPAAARDFDLDTATLYNLPQDRPPVLTDFRLLPANYSLNPAPEPLPPPVLTLGQVINPNQPAPGGDAGDAKRKNTFLASQLVPNPGSQVAYWTATDADGDTLAYTFSIRPAGATTWTDVAVDIRDSFTQFDISSLADGLYRTRLVVAEQAPRPAAERLRVEFQTDDLVVDHTPPEILDAAVRREDGKLIVTVHGRDALSLLDGAEFDFNNGYRELVLHPVDGILDGRDETFELRTPLQNVTGATSVEIHLADQPGNTATKRMPLP